MLTWRSGGGQAAAKRQKMQIDGLLVLLCVLVLLVLLDGSKNLLLVLLDVSKNLLLVLLDVSKMF